MSPACRVVPGHWLGPSTLCHTLEALCREHRPAGLRVRVVATAGGGAPVLATSECALCHEFRQLGLRHLCPV